jgi:hypothetical protein
VEYSFNLETIIGKGEGEDGEEENRVLIYTNQMRAFWVSPLPYPPLSPQSYSVAA